MTDIQERELTPEELEAIRLQNEKIAAELAAISPEEMANRQAKARFDYINQQLSSYENRRDEFQKIPEWVSGHAYAPGDVVRHENRKFIKANDADQSPPDDVAGGWDVIM